MKRLLSLLLVALTLWSLAFPALAMNLEIPKHPSTARMRVRPKLGEGVDLNLYRYCGNSSPNFSDPDGLEQLRYGPGATTQMPDYQLSRLPGNVQNAAIAGAIIGLALETAPTAGLALEYIGIRAGVSLISRAGASIYAGSQAVGRALSGGYVCPPIRFGGRGDNQNHHIQIHMDEVGASYGAVQSAVIKDIAYRLKGNFPLSYMGRVVVDGQTFEYRPFLLPDGSTNVGTTFRVR